MCGVYIVLSCGVRDVCMSILWCVCVVCTLY